MQAALPTFVSSMEDDRGHLIQSRQKSNLSNDNVSHGIQTIQPIGDLFRYMHEIHSHREENIVMTFTSIVVNLEPLMSLAVVFCVEISALISYKVDQGFLSRLLL